MSPRLAVGALSPPPSPKHHIRRKSGQLHTTKSSKTTRPVLSRRQTTKTTSKTSPNTSNDDLFTFDSEESESFFNFCTSCDRQLPADAGNFLYCSERCRLIDLPGNQEKTGYRMPASPPLTPFMMTFPPLHERKRSEGRDIVSRFCPSPSLYNDRALLSPESTSALESLRSLSRALEASSSRASPGSLARPSLSPRNTYALPRRASTSSTESESDEDEESEDEEYQRLHRRMPSTPHPGAAIYGTYLKPSPTTYTNCRPLPKKGTPETYRSRSVDLVTPVL